MHLVLKIILSWSFSAILYFKLQCLKCSVYITRTPRFTVEAQFQKEPHV